MIIDPETGMPMDDTMSAPNSTFGGETAMRGLESAGLNPDKVPLIYGILGDLPGASTTTAWNMSRVSNTIVSGGASERGLRNTKLGRGVSPRRNINKIRRGIANEFDTTNSLGAKIHGRLMPKSLGVPGEGGYLSQGIRQTVSPRNFRRLTSAGNIDPAEGSKMYSPFGFVARQGNQFLGGKGIAGKLTRGAGQSSAVQGFLNKTVGMGTDIKYDTDAFSRGTMGRLSAISRIGGMSDKRVLKSANRIVGSLSQMGLNAEGVGSFARFGAGANPALLRGELMGATASTVGGQISGRFAGYYAGAQAQRLGADYVTGALSRTAEGSAARIGLERGIAHFGAEGAAGSVARVVGSAGFSTALRAAGPIGTALLVGDLASMAGKVLGQGVNVLRDAGRTLVAPLNKGVMGNAFQDNPTAATARQRGVMAIANSRLNMRSIMGHEASAMNAYYN